MHACQGRFLHIYPIAPGSSIRQDDAYSGVGMSESSRNFEPNRSGCLSRPLRVSIPLKAFTRSSSGAEELDGRLEMIDETTAQICLDHPLAEGSDVEVTVEFRDRRNREIRFRYDATVASAVCRLWYEMAVTFKEGVGISGKDAREILADLFPEAV